jgi:hypothetical protein
VRNISGVVAGISSASLALHLNSTFSDGSSHAGKLRAQLPRHADAAHATAAHPAAAHTTASHLCSLSSIAATVTGVSIGLSAAAQQWYSSR